MTREEASALWTSFCGEQGYDINLDAVSDFIAGVANNERRVCTNIALRMVQGECCDAIVAALSPVGEDTGEGR